MKRTTGSLHEEQHTALIVSHSIALREKKVFQAKAVEKIERKYFKFNIDFFIPKIMLLLR
jgi:hypothetical protein